MDVSKIWNLFSFFVATAKVVHINSTNNSNTTQHPRRDPVGMYTFSKSAASIMGGLQSTKAVVPDREHLIDAIRLVLKDVSIQH